MLPVIAHNLLESIEQLRACAVQARQGDAGFTVNTSHIASWSRRTRSWRRRHPVIGYELGEGDRNQANAYGRECQRTSLEITDPFGRGSRRILDPATLAEPVIKGKARDGAWETPFHGCHSERRGAHAPKPCLGISRHAWRAAPGHAGPVLCSSGKIAGSCGHQRSTGPDCLGAAHRSIREISLRCLGCAAAPLRSE